MTVGTARDEIFETAFGTNIDKIERRFEAWMSKQYGFSLYHVDSALKAETFLEIWSQYSKLAGRHLRTLEQADSKRQSCQEIVDKLALLKSGYDQLSPAENKIKGEEQEVQEQQIQQQMILPGSSGLKEDHFTIAKRG